MPTRVTAPSHDPLGYERGSLDYMPDRVPRNYPRDICRCSHCVAEFARQSGYTTLQYNPANYRAATPVRRYSMSAFTYFSTPEPPGVTHPRPPSRWSSYEQEQDVPTALQNLIVRPLRYILRRSGRVWSAEVEINELTSSRAANILGVNQGRYSTRPDRACIIATDDGTVDAEIKVSCMRDGSQVHADMARGAYDLLKQHGGACHVNAGHHVHVDATRIADLGMERGEEVMRAAWTVAKVCQRALVPLASSGYKGHRGQSARFMDNAWWGRQAIHGGRLYGALRAGSDQNATIEYRLPNATLSPIRAQSFITVPLGILDLVERALLDEDEIAREFVRQAEDRHVHANDFDELTATSFLLDAVRFSKDSRKALAVAAFTSPSASPKAVELWENAADLPKRLGSYLETTPRTKKKATRDTPARVIPRNPDGTFAPGAQAQAESLYARLQSTTFGNPQPIEPPEDYPADEADWRD